MRILRTDRRRGRRKRRDVSLNGRFAAFAELDHTVRLIEVGSGHIKATMLVSGDAASAIAWAVPP